VLFAILSTPPNVIWQSWLESKFPGYTSSAPTSDKELSKKHNSKGTVSDQKSLDIKNTAIKFALDQTLGAAVNTLLFIAGIDLLRGRSVEVAWSDCREGLWPLMFAGWKLWPMVSIINFALVPLEYRIVVGSTVGLFWGVYLSLMSSSKK
jgi:protein Mpv17